MRFGLDGWLEPAASGLPEVIKVPSVRTSSLAADLKVPLGIVWHWTGGVCRGVGASKWLADSIRTFDRTKDRPASWHVLVAKDGRIFQSVPANMGAWHVGRPGRIGGLPVKPGAQWDATAWPGRLFANVNAATLGVELENSGRLEKVGDKFFCWPFWLDPDNRDSGPDPKLEIEPARAVLHGAQWFDAYPEAQEMAATRLLQAAVLAFRWSRDVAQYGHVMFDPARKEDPGPVWQEIVLPRILDRVFGAG